MLLAVLFFHFAEPIRPIIDQPATQQMEMLDLAKTAMAEKRWADAHELLNKAKKLDKKNPEVYLLLGDLQAALNKPSMAKSYYKKAEKLGVNIDAYLAKL